MIWVGKLFLDFLVSRYDYDELPPYLRRRLNNTRLTLVV